MLFLCSWFRPLLWYTLIWSLISPCPFTLPLHWIYYVSFLQAFGPLLHISSCRIQQSEQSGIFVHGELFSQHEPAPLQANFTNSSCFQAHQKEIRRIVKLDGDWILSSLSPHLSWISNVICDYSRDLGKGEEESLPSQLWHCWVSS